MKEEEFDLPFELDPEKLRAQNEKLKDVQPPSCDGDTCESCSG